MAMRAHPAGTLRRHMAGFNLVELMIVVGVMAVLAAIAAPNMAKMVSAQRLKTAAFDVVASLSYARSEAVKRNTTVAINPVSGNWANGWQVVDSNGNVLRKQDRYDGSITFTGPNTVVFNSSGRVPPGVNPFNLSSFGMTTNRCRIVNVDSSGRAVSEEGGC